MIFSRPISTALSPNTQKDDVSLAKSLLKGQQAVRVGKAENTPVKGQRMALEAYFAKEYGQNSAFAFNSGRSALLAILTALNLPKGSAIGVQGFTCNAVINPIIKAGYRPIYIDIDDDLNMDFSILRQKHTQLKAVIIQHTFGMPARIEEICDFAKQNNLFVIEDCAHALGVKFKEKLLGTFGDVAFFSFGRDKMISSVFGGVAIAKDASIQERLSAYYKNCAQADPLWTYQQLRHPILFENVVLPFYNFLGLGKRFLSLYLKTGKLGRAVESRECLGQWNEKFPALMPEELACLALNQISKLNEYLEHRKALSDFYTKSLEGNLEFALPFIEAKNQGIPFMRFPILANDRKKVLKSLSDKGIYLDDGWGGKNIVPEQTELVSMEYQLGSCPKAEALCKKIVNLPTSINISLNDAKLILQYLTKNNVGDKRN